MTTLATIRLEKHDGMRRAFVKTPDASFVTESFSTSDACLHDVARRLTEPRAYELPAEAIEAARAEVP